ncbi:unnamed protein product, partial [Rotaria sp. Silwood2]
GYPLVTVIEEQQPNQTRIIKLNQQRFIADGSADDENLQWKIPITIFYKIKSKDNISENDWIKLNYNSIGLYRVKYESKTLACLSEPIANKKLSPQDRLMIQDDVAALCNADHQSFVDYLKLLLSYKDEDNFTVWKSIASTMGEKLGWDEKENENPLVAMLRPMILSIMGKSGDQAIIDEAKKRFPSHINGDLIDSNIRAAVYIIVSLYGDENTQEELRKLYKTAEMTEEKVRLLCSMGQSLKP